MLARAALLWEGTVAVVSSREEYKNTEEFLTCLKTLLLDKSNRLTSTINKYIAHITNENLSG